MKLNLSQISGASAAEKEASVLQTPAQFVYSPFLQRKYELPVVQVI